MKRTYQTDMLSKEKKYKKIENDRVAQNILKYPFKNVIQIFECSNGSNFIMPDNFTRGHRISNPFSLHT